MKNNFFVNKSILKKKSNRILLLVMTFLLILLFYLSNITLIVINTLNDYKYKNIDNRTLVVFSDEKVINEEKLLKTEHITQVMLFNNSYVVISSEEFDHIKLFPLNDNELKNIEIRKGEKKLGNYNIICPYEFIPVDDLYGEKNNISKNVINTDKVINKSFDVKLENWNYTGDYPNLLDSKTNKFTIVGNYENKKYMLENYTCFIDIDDMNSIVSFISNNNSNDNIYSIVVDNVSNLDSVIKELENDDYIVTKKINTNSYLIRILIILSIIFFLTILLLFLSSINFNIKRDIKNKEKEILLYKSIGYSEKKLKSIYLTEYFIVCVFAIILSIIISSISFLLLKNYLNNFLTYKMFIINIHSIVFFMLFIFGVFFTEFIVYIKISKILKIKKLNL